MKHPSASLVAMVASLVVTASSTRAGQFKPVYTPVSNPEFKEWQAELQGEKTLESLAAELNAELTLPTDVTLTFGECGVANAFYDPEKRAITICYELVGEMYDVFSGDGATEEQVEEAVTNASAFFFYHEVGHALIHVLDLPTTGKEEDAVDQLSTYVLTTEAEEGEGAAALDGAAAFMVWSESAQASGQQSPFWDEHSLNEQRFFNIVCWVYGSDPAKFDSLVKDGFLPPDRAGRCGGEWAQIEKSWSRLLAPSMKGD